jgi:hypothetical protein
MHLADHRHQILGRHALEPVAPGLEPLTPAGCPRRLRRSSEHDDAGFWELRPVSDDRVDALHVEKSQC